VIKQVWRDQASLAWSSRSGVIKQVWREARNCLITAEVLDHRGDAW